MASSADRLPGEAPAQSFTPAAQLSGCKCTGGPMRLPEYITARDIRAPGRIAGMWPGLPGQERLMHPERLALEGYQPEYVTWLGSLCGWTATAGGAQHLMNCISNIIANQSGLALEINKGGQPFVSPAWCWPWQMQQKRITLAVCGVPRPQSSEPTPCTIVGGCVDQKSALWAQMAVDSSALSVWCRQPSNTARWNRLVPVPTVFRASFPLMHDLPGAWPQLMASAIPRLAGRE
eukprot:gene6416-biopygen5376